MFHGFDGYSTNETKATTTKMETLAIEKFLEIEKVVTDEVLKQPSTSSTSSSVATNKPHNFTCPEEEKPANIGPYEVPTQRDLVMQMKADLTSLFQNYHTKALLFLEDIKEATRATDDIAKKCHSKNRELYKKCVKHVNIQCKVITKSVVTSLEYQRHDIFAITNDQICKLSAMKIDPVDLIKVLAMELASLEYALPSFLRLLDACSLYCNSRKLNDVNVHVPPTSTSHLSDQELVVKHFLSQKSYKYLIKRSQH
ncbi:hypothetical protein ACJJTC_015869 [Scirpophaga incertulas]